jgi:hypothetical protein
MRAVATALALLAAAPAAALPEGRFVDREGANRVALTRDDGRIELAVVSAAAEVTLEAELARNPETGLWEQPERDDGWFSRLLGDRPTALPFEGERLVFAREEGDALIVTTLEVDDGGRPMLLRLALESVEGGLRLDVRRVDEGQVSAIELVPLEREAP